MAVLAVGLAHTLHPGMPETAWTRCQRRRTAATPVADAPAPTRPAVKGPLLVQFYNARLATPEGLMEGELWMQQGKIVDAQQRFWQREDSAADCRIDCHGLILAPGFVDVHMRGAFGVDFASLHEATEDEAERAIGTVCRRLPELGVTAFCPTLRGCSPEVYRRLLPRLMPRTGPRKAALVGVHLDGPFCTIGASPPSSLEGGWETLSATYGPALADGVAAAVTLAPELAGAAGAVEALQQRGIVVGLGRTEASLDQCREAVRHGARLVSQMLRDMPPFHHRDPGPLGLLVEEAQAQAKSVGDAAGDAAGGARAVYYTMTLDDAHTHPAALNLAQSTHPEGLIVASDSTRDMPRAASGATEAGKAPSAAVEEDDEDADAGTFAACVRHLHRHSGATDPSAAILAGSLHPAELLGLTSKGRLSHGADADLTLLDDSLQVRGCFVGGQLAWAHADLHGALWFHR